MKQFRKKSKNPYNLILEDHSVSRDQGKEKSCKENLLKMMHKAGSAIAG